MRRLAIHENKDQPLTDMQPQPAASTALDPDTLAMNEIAQRPPTTPMLLPILTWEELGNLAKALNMVSRNLDRDQRRVTDALFDKIVQGATVLPKPNGAIAKPDGNRHIRRAKGAKT